MNVVALDLEFNMPSRKIIEMGITIGDVEKRSVLDKRSWFVNPNEILEERIIKLTGITQKDVDNAPSLIEVFKRMTEWLRNFDIHKQPVTWGGGDLRELKKQVQEVNPNLADFPFGHTEMNVKCLVQAHRTALGLSSQGGLGKCLTYYGMRFNGRQHTAESDSFNTLLMYYKMLDLFKQIKV